MTKQKYDANERKQELRMIVRCKCVVCGEPLPHDLFDLAHRVNKSKTALDSWGSEVINHPMNLVPTCHGTKAGKSCNDACNIGKQPVKARELLNQIVRINMGRESMPDLAEYYRSVGEEVREKRRGA